LVAAAENAAMPRSLVWIERPNLGGFGCSGCRWVFRSTSPFLGESIEQMKQLYNEECDKEFTAHTCSQFANTKNAEGQAGDG